MLAALVFSCTPPPVVPSLRSSVPVRWAVELEGKGFQRPMDMATDERLLAVVGGFTGSLKLRAGLEMNSDAEDGYLAVFDRDGELQWSFTLAGPGAQRLNAVSMLDEVVVVAGQSSAGVTVGGQRLGADEAPLGLVVALERSTGKVRWTADLGLTQVQSVKAMTVTADGLFVAGIKRFSGPSMVSFVARLALADGAEGWVLPIKSVAASQEQVPFVEVARVVVAADGQVVVAGQHTGAGLEGFPTAIPSAGDTSAFAAWVTPSGQPAALGTNIFRQSHVGQAAIHHHGLIDQVNLLANRADGALMLGGFTAKSLSHDVDVALSEVRIAVLTPTTIETSFQLKTAPVMVVADAESATQTGRYAISITGLPSEENGGREWIAVYDNGEVVAKVTDVAVELRAVAVKTEAKRMAMLLSKRATANGQVSGTTVLVDLSL